jgi:hypothetical protein
MFVLILVVLLYVCVDFGGSFVCTKDPPKSTETYKRPTKINRNIQKTHQNQHKHTKEPPKILVGLLYVCVDFGGSFVCLC